MKRFRTGVIAGKFYPPHRGHELLIRTALEQCDEVYVLACFNSAQTIPIARRVEWLREMCPAARILSVLDVPADDDSPGWAAYTRQLLGFAPEAVFSSESYGDAYARCLGAVHVCVDPQRRRVPCSATMIRSDPLAHLDCLAPLRPRVVRAASLPRGGRVHRQDHSGRGPGPPLPDGLDARVRPRVLRREAGPGHNGALGSPRVRRDRPRARPPGRTCWRARPGAC